MTSGERLRYLLLLHGAQMAAATPRITRAGNVMFAVVIMASPSPIALALRAQADRLAKEAAALCTPPLSAVVPVASKRRAEYKVRTLWRKLASLLETEARHLDRDWLVEVFARDELEAAHDIGIVRAVMD